MGNRLDCVSCGKALMVDQAETCSEDCTDKALDQLRTTITALTSDLASLRRVVEAAREWKRSGPAGYRVDAVLALIHAIEDYDAVVAKEIR
jgi:hypothetical protein